MNQYYDDEDEEEAKEQDANIMRDASHEQKENILDNDIPPDTIHKRQISDIQFIKQRDMNLLNMLLCKSIKTFWDAVEFNKGTDFVKRLFTTEWIFTFK